MTTPWPWAGDSREDRAKRVAASYRTALHHLNTPDAHHALQQLDQHWAQWIEWHTPRTAPLNPDDWINARDAAHLADVTPSTIRKWAERHHITTTTADDGSPRYNIGQLINHQARQRQQRHHRNQ